MTPGERLFARLLHLYPRDFRERYEEDLLAFFRQDHSHPRYGSGRMRPVRFWTATIRDLVRSAWRQRTGASGTTEAISRRPASWPGRLRADVLHGWRGLRASRGVTLSALAVLTLGIGTSTAIFSVVDAVALRGLPFPDAGRLVSVAETDRRGGTSDPISAAPQNYADWRARQNVFEHLGASSRSPSVTTAGPVVETLRPIRLTASLFGVLRVAPALGRPFRAEDERAGAPRVVILSDGLWRSRFNARPDVVGQMLTLESGALEIVGVMPRGFTWPMGSTLVSAVDIWTPFVPTERDTLRDARVGRNYNQSVVARLRPGVTVDQAGAQMMQIRDALALDYPRWFADRGVSVRPLQEAIVGNRVRSWMLFLLGSVGCVLLIACLNVANLLLARAVSRSREVAVRAALGASPWDLARSLIVESLMLSSAGTFCGVLLAFWGVKVLRATLPEQLPRLANVAVDLRVLGVAVAAAVVTGVFFGTLPALQLSRPNVAGVLGQGGRSQTGGTTGQRIRTVLVMAEVALAVVLLAGAGFFITSFARVVNIDLGFSPDHVVSVGVSPRGPRATPEQRAQLAVNNQLLIASAVERVQAVPGVIAASALSSGLPLSGSYMTMPVKLPGRETSFTRDDEAWVHGVSPGYLDVMRQTLLRGRWIAAGDTAGAPAVVVLSDEAGRRYFGGEDPLGQTILLNDSPRTVVGVVRGARAGGPEAGMAPEAYIPFLQSDQVSADVVLRSALDVAAIGPLVQAAIASVVPAQAVSTPETIDRYFTGLIAQRKFNMIVLALFGALAILIAAVGLYGLMAFLVAHRTREIGVRLALGAVPAGIVQMVLGRATWLIAAGLVAGLVGAGLLERVVRTFLFDARSYDPLVYGSVAAILLLTGLAAALGPARRAARTDPLVALRSE